MFFTTCFCCPHVARKIIHDRFKSKQKWKDSAHKLLVGNRRQNFIIVSQITDDIKAENLKPPAEWK